jgi:hypothetical protein
MESGAERMSGNVYGYLPGRRDSLIVVTAHVDGYFYAVHDNGATAASVLALAEHYASIGKNEREHGLLFLFVGDHENPGVGGTINFVEQHAEWLKENLLLVIRPEKLGLMLREGGSQRWSGFPEQPSAILKWIDCGLGVARRASAARKRLGARSVDNPIFMLPSTSG